MQFKMVLKTEEDKIALENLFKDIEQLHPDFDEFPDPLVLVGHELGNWAQRTYRDGNPEAAEVYTQYREMMKKGDEERTELISEMEEIGCEYSDLISTGLQAMEGYVQILRDDDPGSIAIGDFMDDLVYQERIESGYDRDQRVRGNEALFVPFHTMIRTLMGILKEIMRI